MKVVILAGGEGKRLRPLTESVPKPLVQIGGKAIIDWQIESFMKLGVNDFVVLAGYKSDELKRHFASHHAKVQILIEDRPLGTAGAMKSAQQLIGEEDFVAVNGDIMTDLDLSPMLSGADGLLAKIALVPMVSPFGVVRTFGDKVTGFEEKPILRDVYINAGIYWFSNRALDFMQEKASVEKDVFPRLAKDGVLGFFRFQIHNRFWRSIDNLNDCEEARRHFE